MAEYVHNMVSGLKTVFKVGGGTLVGCMLAGCGAKKVPLPVLADYIQPPEKAAFCVQANWGEYGVEGCAFNGGDTVQISLINDGRVGKVFIDSPQHSGVRDPKDGSGLDTVIIPSAKGVTAYGQTVIIGPDGKRYDCRCETASSPINSSDAETIEQITGTREWFKREFIPQYGSLREILDPLFAARMEVMRAQDQQKEQESLEKAIDAAKKLSK